MSRSTITTSGAIVYRTKLMKDSRQARAFAACLSANGRFCDVAAEESRTAKNPAWFVTFRPSNLARQQDLYQAQQDARARRAATEGMDYLFVRDASWWWCFNPISGETYEVTVFGCTCGDYVYRCCRAGLNCKHQQALGLQGEAGMLDDAVSIAA